MDERLLARLIVGIVLGLLGSFAYLLLFNPPATYEWLVRRRLGWWGVETKLVDEAKFRRMTRLVGLLLMVIMAIVLSTCGACLRSGNG